MDLYWKKSQDHAISNCYQITAVLHHQMKMKMWIKGA